MEKASKTQKKRQALAVQDLGRKLVELQPEQLEKIPLPEDIREAVVLAQKITRRGGRKRQEQYIGALMRKTDSRPISEALESIETGTRKQAELHKRIETWRDELVGGNDALLADLSSRVSGADRDQLTDLVHKARIGKAQPNSDPAPTRALFRLLRKIAS